MIDTEAFEMDETQKRHAPKPVPVLCIGTRVGDGVRSTRRRACALCDLRMRRPWYARRLLVVPSEHLAGLGGADCSRLEATVSAAILEAISLWNRDVPAPAGGW